MFFTFSNSKKHWKGCAWCWPRIIMVKFWKSCISGWEGRLTLNKGGGSRSFMTMTMTIWWQRSGVRIYRIVTGVTSDVCVPSTHLVFKQILVIDGWGISCKIALLWMSLDFTDDQSMLVQVLLCAVKQQAITWANVDPDLCCHMMSLGQNEFIGAIALVLQDIHHNIIVFCNISWIWTEYEKKIKCMQFWCTQNYFYIIYSYLIWCDNPLNKLHIISLGDNWYFSDSSWICFIEIKFEIIPIISFTTDGIGVSHIYMVSIFKFIFMLIDLMAVISDNGHWINDGVIVIFFFMMPTLLFSNIFMCVDYLY